MSYGYGGTGKVSENNKFFDYGEPYSTGDIICCCIDLDANPRVVLFTKNGRYLGVAFRLGAESNGQTFFPHVTVRNMSLAVNFGQRQPYSPSLQGFSLISRVPPQNLERGSVGPASRQECEIIMMVGLPGAGKTVWAMKYANNHPEKKYCILGTNMIIDNMKVMGLMRKRNYQGRWDALIKQATDILNKMFKITERKNRNYILDQTNVYFSARRRKMSNFRGYRRIAAVVVTTDEVLKERTAKSEEEEGKIIPESAVLEMKANFVLPEVGEFFDDVWFIEEDKATSEHLVAEFQRAGKEYKEDEKTRKPSKESGSSWRQSIADRRPLGRSMSWQGGPRGQGAGKEYKENEKKTEPSEKSGSSWSQSIADRRSRGHFISWQGGPRGQGTGKEYKENKKKREPSEKSGSSWRQSIADRRPLGPSMAWQGGPRGQGAGKEYKENEKKREPEKSGSSGSQSTADRRPRGPSMSWQGSPRGQVAGKEFEENEKKGKPSEKSGSNGSQSLADKRPRGPSMAWQGGPRGQHPRHSDHRGGFQGNHPTRGARGASNNAPFRGPPSGAHVAPVRSYNNYGQSQGQRQQHEPYETYDTGPQRECNDYGPSQGNRRPGKAYGTYASGPPMRCNDIVPHQGHERGREPYGAYGSGPPKRYDDNGPSYRQQQSHGRNNGHSFDSSHHQPPRSGEGRYSQAAPTYGQQYGQSYDSQSTSRSYPREYDYDAGGVQRGQTPQGGRSAQYRYGRGYWS